jgi:hypothetical protein
VQGQGPNYNQADARGKSKSRGNSDSFGKDNSPNSPEKPNSKGKDKTDDERKRDEGVGRDNWRYRQTGNRWWYWTAGQSLGVSGQQSLGRHFLAK